MRYLKHAFDRAIHDSRPLILKESLRWRIGTNSKRMRTRQICSFTLFTNLTRSYNYIFRTFSNRAYFRRKIHRKANDSIRLQLSKRKWI